MATLTRAAESREERQASRYVTIAVRGFTKEALARAIDDALAPWQPADIVSISYMDQPLYLLGRRNSALITICCPDEDDGAS